MILDFFGLFNDLMPYVGDFFGLLSGFAFVEPLELLEWISSSFMYNGYDFVFDYVNVYTGISSTFTLGYGFWQIPIIGQIFGSIVNLIGLVIFNAFLDVPLVFSLPLGFATMGIVFALCAYISKIVKIFLPS